MIKSLLRCFKSGVLEVGIDEVARGCLAGRVYASAVIWNTELEDPLISKIRDSKKLTAIQRGELRQFIECNAIAWGIGYVEEDKIDEINIRNATFMAMHRALDNMNIKYPSIYNKIEHIIIDGNAFVPYKNIPFQCVVKGDDKYLSIACASILAKTHRDEYLMNLTKTYPTLHRYGWHHNSAYGTKDHIEAIKTFGITQFHRKTFGICKTSNIVMIEPMVPFSIRNEQLIIDAEKQPLQLQISSLLNISTIQPPLPPQELEETIKTNKRKRKTNTKEKKQKQQKQQKQPKKKEKKPKPTQQPQQPTEKPKLNLIRKTTTTTNPTTTNNETTTNLQT